MTFERGGADQMRLHVLPTEQFKTYAVSVYIGAPLQESSVTPLALIPFVLRRGTQDYPETKRFRERLDEMYGAGFGIDIYKRGDYQIVQFRLDMVDDRFLKSESGSLLSQAIEFIGSVITRPALDNGIFLDKYVEAEKDTIKKRLESIVNDKIRYAAERCIQEMCRNEPYCLNPLGRIEDLPHLDAGNLMKRYNEWLGSSPIDIYVAGPTTLAEVEPLIRQAFPIKRAVHSDYQLRSSPVEKSETREIVEQMDVKQGKLNLGLRTDVTYGNDDYPAILMYNGILGGYPHSKLFMNVREKASLAYYASSRYDGHKGLLTVQSGIETEQFQKALDIIKKQLEDMKAMTISDLELSQTRSMISGQLREIQDSAFERIGFDFNTVLSGRKRTVPELLEAVQHIGCTDIGRVAERVELDTIYFLRGQGEHA